jgi:hypothetical protein
MSYDNHQWQDEVLDADTFSDEIELNIDVEALGNLTLRLAQLMAEEVDILDQMRVSDLVPLQEEKLMLTAALEQQKRVLDMRPDLVERMSDEERAYLSEVVGVFENVLEQNHRRLRIARDVNLSMVQAVQQALLEHSSRGTYSVRGVTEKTGDTVSVTLNNVV